MKTKKQLSLRAWFPGAVILLWIIPILIIIISAGMLLSSSMRKAAENELTVRVEDALRQTCMRFSALIDESKAISYDGRIRAAYRTYEADGDKAALYKETSEYLNQRFSRDEKVKAVFINFIMADGISPYIVNREEINYRILKEYRDGAENEILNYMKDADSGLKFKCVDGKLYLIRNLLDGKFETYATVTMLCDADALLQSLGTVSIQDSIRFSINSDSFILSDGRLEKLDSEETELTDTLTFLSETDGLTIGFYADVSRINRFASLPEYKIAVFAIVFLTVPFLAVMLFMLYRHVIKPVETLVAATEQVQQGKRGYLITEVPVNMEFGTLYSHFNAMSEELKAQFERLYREQQELQKAKIKALQSQINPHFLNNTLEVINWEARLAENDKVSAMIEALSTMLNASTDRDGRSIVTLREELEYVNAYLYIIRERLGGRLKDSVMVEDDLMETPIPKLILQPIVENAIEHDIAGAKGGEVSVSAEVMNGIIHLKVEHDGTLMPEDEENINRLSGSCEIVSAESGGGQVGLRNVVHRLKLIYGEEGHLTISQYLPGKIRAEITFPVHCTI